MESLNKEMEMSIMNVNEAITYFNMTAVLTIMARHGASFTLTSVWTSFSYCDFFTYRHQ